MFDLHPAEFEIVKTDGQDARIVQMDAGDEVEDEPVDAVSERIWNITLRARPGLTSPAKTFSFARPKNPEIKTSYFRYADPGGPLHPIVGGCRKGRTGAKLFFGVFERQILTEFFGTHPRPFREKPLKMKLAYIGLIG